jgi:hypothetical protein
MHVLFLHETQANYNIIFVEHLVILRSWHLYAY